ncbi:hypothetical protein BOTCAL_0645g00010 [Botryotinia calthae]|uniref:Uncharacterized protein n=1 Tax=Botryotinia calthae TaxID=38488 RepID=A0A4Y8CI15_9HELO|nr:hypothetical protein BOTCAL_0645g00010 [Botryotinia calthae]
MATFDPILYSYVPTVPRFKSTTLRQISIQKQFSIPKKTVIDNDDSYRLQLQEIDTVCDTSQKNISLEDLDIGNASWEDETASQPKDRCPSGKNESLPLLDSELMDRSGNDRGTQDKPLILEDHESNLSNHSNSPVPANSLPGLNKQDRIIGHEMWLNIESDGSSKNDNISLSLQDTTNLPSQEQPCYCDNSLQPIQSEIDLYTDDDIAQHRSVTSLYYNRPIPLAIENGESNQGSAFGYEVGLFPVFDKQEELLTISQKKDDNTETRKKRLHSLETEIDNNDENDKDPQSTKREKLYPLPTNNVPILFPGYYILITSSTTQSKSDDV